MTDIESLVKEAIKRHPGQGKIIKISKKDLKRANEACKASMQRERTRSIKNGRDIIVG